MHGACAALPVVAALLRPGESNRLTDAIEQRRPRINAKLPVLAVDTQRDGDRARNARRVRNRSKRAALAESAVRVHWCAHCYNCTCCSLSCGPKKCPARWI